MNYDVLLNLRGLRQNNGQSQQQQHHHQQHHQSQQQQHSHNDQNQGRSQRPTAFATRIPAPVGAAGAPRHASSSKAGGGGSANEEIKGKLMSIWNNVKFGLSGVRTGGSFSKVGTVIEGGRPVEVVSRPETSKLYVYVFICLRFFCLRFLFVYVLITVRFFASGH